MKKILIIDDDQELCEEITENLQDEGYFVNTAFDGLEGKKLIEKYDYDILILDLKLPGINGFDIFKSVKDKHAKLKVLILTGRPLIKQWSREETGVIEDKEEDLLKLTDGFINKPFDVKAVLAKVKELIGKV